YDKSLQQKKAGGVSPAQAAALALFLASSEAAGLTGRIISAVWDNWQDIPKHLAEIARLIDDRLRASDDVSHDALGRLILDMAFGQSVVFNKKTHRKEARLNQRFPYVYYAASLVVNHRPQDMHEEAVAHLRRAQEVQQSFWGDTELNRLGPVSAAELDSDTQAGLRRALGAEGFAEIAPKPFASLDSAVRERIRDELGRQLAHGLHRQLMLAVSTQLWVDYLTTIEGLRTSISLEAYAQRDPLTAYKSRAFGLFQQLLVDVRAGVVSRLFTFRSRNLTELRAEVDRGAGPAGPKRTLGRNDPCHCGSGKKYKNCHMMKDQPG
ncbi:MAG: SEC-C metal-binding domain-containing protein, partial [Chloroflexota bacterium]